MAIRTLVPSYANLDSSVVTYQLLSEGLKTATVKAGKSVDVTAWDDSKGLTITTASVRWCYRRADVPLDHDAFLGWGLFMKRVVKARVEPDGAIVLLRPEQRMTDRTLEQPKGFPLEPSSDCENA